MSAPEKDWNERFERAQAKPRHWRGAAGVILIGLKVIQFVTLGGPTAHLEAPNSAEIYGAYFGDLLVFALAVWLIWSGFKRATVKIPKD